MLIVMVLKLSSALTLAVIIFFTCVQTSGHAQVAVLQKLAFIFSFLRQCRLYPYFIVEIDELSEVKLYSLTQGQLLPIDAKYSLFKL